MEHYNSIGDVVRYLRKKEELSQEQLANILYLSKTVISKIESGKREATQEQLILLSNFFKFDLLTFATKIHNFKTLEHYLLSHELTDYIRNNQFDEIYNVTQSNPTFIELNYGTPKILSTYCNTLIQIHIHKNINNALMIATEFFNVKLSDFSKFTPIISESNQYYSLILTLCYCLCEIGNQEKALLVYERTLTFLESTYFNENLPFLNIDNFYRKFYIICLNNIADIYFNSQDYELALEYCNKALLNSNKLNILSILPHLIKLKIEILCSQNEYTLAKETYMDFKSICRLTYQEKYFNASTDTFKSKYLPLF